MPLQQTGKAQIPITAISVSNPSKGIISMLALIQHLANYGMLAQRNAINLVMGRGDG